jgi:GMP synthase (glutamine-hydrolysing)
MQKKILILDFGSQYTQLIGRKIRELNVYCEIHPYNNYPEIDESVRGVILSGSQCSVRDDGSPCIYLSKIKGILPVLGIGYGARYIAHFYGGEVVSSNSRKYGKAELGHIDIGSTLFRNIKQNTQVWMSYGDTIVKLPENSKAIASTEDVNFAAYKIDNEETYAVQFHPEVYYTTEGLQLLRNFVVDICKCSQDWTPESFIENTINDLKEKLGNDKVVLGLSGGVDSSVTAVLLNKAIGKNLHCIFVDHGLLRKNEFEDVLHSYEDMGLNVLGIDAKQKFWDALAGITEPEQKRKIIGRNFIDVFDTEANKIKNVKWLAQGTIYPDVIESISINSHSTIIKSHHNVGGLPEKMNLKIVEPLRLLFKDEVRRVGKALGIKQELLGRHPFPGPGLGIRILGDITPEKIKVLQEADAIFIKGLRDWGLYNSVWQAAVILLPIQSVGVMDDKRTYEDVVALRVVTSTDAMTADWVHLPYDFLAKMSNEIINKVSGINRVVYDISSKPPATIEWE